MAKPKVTYKKANVKLSGPPEGGLKPPPKRATKGGGNRTSKAK